MISKKERMTQNIIRHGNDLLQIFPASRIDNAIELCKALRRYELKATRLTIAMCNGVDSATQTAHEAELDRIHDKVCQLLGVERFCKDIFINRDPRGYALKLNDEFARDKRIHKDWGGYGILAPDYSEN